MTFRTLINAQQLADLCATDPSLVILDARFSLDDEEWGDRAFRENHIPGAQRADLARHMSGPIVEGRTGRRPFPSADEFAATMRSWGIGPSTQVVAYDADRGLMAASRLWLMIKWAGHDRVAVLDGGLPAWEATGLDTTPAIHEPPTPDEPFELNVRDHMLADVHEVDRARTSEPTTVFDSRGADGYHGRGKYYDPVRGHIKGAGLADRAQTLTADEIGRAHV